MNSKPMDVKKRRNADYKLKAEGIYFKAASLDRLKGTCGNIRSQIEGDKHIPGEWDTCFEANVSAPYLLARLCALFPGLNIQTCGQEAYKVTWRTVIEHAETGHFVTFYDYKGGACFGSDVYGPNTPKSFIRDVKKLIKALRNDRFPHPYDGCVVGEIA